MSSRTFFLLAFCVFCAVLIIIPFGAMYFEVTSIEGRAVEWLQVLAGFSALAIGAVTLYFVTVQLHKSDQQLTKANDQLIKADIQIELANKQIELANIQLELARKDSAVLTLQLRANALAAVETDFSAVDSLFSVLRGKKFGTIATIYDNRAKSPSTNNYYFRLQDELSELLVILNTLEQTLVKNIESIAHHLPDEIFEERVELVHRLNMLSLYLYSQRENIGDTFDTSDRDTALNCTGNYYNLLIPLISKYRALLNEAKSTLVSDI